MSPLIMYITSSLGSLWNSLRNSRPRATNAMLSGACQSTVLGRPEPRIVFITSPRLTAFMSSMAALSPDREQFGPGRHAAALPRRPLAHVAPLRIPGGVAERGADLVERRHVGVGAFE